MEAEPSAFPETKSCHDAFDHAGDRSSTQTDGPPLSIRGRGRSADQVPPAYTLISNHNRQLQIDEARGVNLELTTVGESDPPFKLSDLIERVQDRTRSCTELERLAMAVEYGELLKVMGDDLVGHFVEQARGAGASWAQVGQQLGVTKQAAYQRHFSRRRTFHFGRQFKPEAGGPFERFTQEAREVIVTAQQEARSLLHNYLGVEHLLLGLSADRVVGPLLSAAGASRDAILDQVRQIVGEGRDTPAGTIPFTPRAKRALEVAARAAGRPGEQIEPAHVLLGVLDLREGVGAQILDLLEVPRDDLRRKAKAVPPSQD